MISHWRALLEEKAADWNLPANGKWSLLLFNNYTHELHMFQQQCNINLLWFNDAGKFPQALTKLCRDDANLRREFQNLTQVYPHASMWAPRPLGFLKRGRFWGLWMGGVPGASSLQLDSRPARLLAVAKTLASMHNALRNKGTAFGTERYRHLVLEPFRAVADFGSQASVLKGCNEIRARISAEWIDSLPTIPQHGDLLAGNLVVDGTRWYVVDWDNFNRVDFPFYDLLTLLISLLTARGESVEQWNPDLVKQIPDLIKCYGLQLGLTDKGASLNVSLLLPLTLANWFHVQWSEGRRQFSDRMYKIIQDYFDRPSQWQRVFCPV